METTRRRLMIADGHAQRSWLVTTRRSIGDSVLIVNVAGKVIYINDSALRLLRAGSAECVGKPMNSVLRMCFSGSGLPVDDLAEIAALEKQPLPLPRETYLRTMGGAKIPIEGAIDACRVKGRCCGWVVAFREVALRQLAVC